MTEEKSKWIEAVAKMIKLTQNGKIKWESEEPDTVPKKGEDDRIESVFVAIYKEKTLRIYRRRYKRITINDAIASITGTGKVARPPLWDYSVVLELIKAYDQPVWAFPKEDILKDLLSAVQYQVSGVKEFLDEILIED